MLKRLHAFSGYGVEKRIRVALHPLLRFATCWKSIGVWFWLNPHTGRTLNAQKFPLPNFTSRHCRTALPVPDPERLSAGRPADFDAHLTLTHLPTALSQSYSLPGEALIVGWPGRNMPVNAHDAHEYEVLLRRPQLAALCTHFVITICVEAKASSLGSSLRGK